MSFLGKDVYKRKAVLFWIFLFISFLHTVLYAQTTNDVLKKPITAYSGPGGINAKIKMWLRADKVQVGAGNVALTWTDIYDPLIRFKSYGRPLYRPNGINYNPAILYRDIDENGAKTLDHHTIDSGASNYKLVIVQIPSSILISSRSILKSKSSPFSETLLTATVRAGCPDPDMDRTKSYSYFLIYESFEKKYTNRVLAFTTAFGPCLNPINESNLLIISPSVNSCSLRCAS